jgi:hypothetical protein
MSRPGGDASERPKRQRKTPTRLTNEDADALVLQARARAASKPVTTPAKSSSDLSDMLILINDVRDQRKPYLVVLDTKEHELPPVLLETLTRHVRCDGIFEAYVKDYCDLFPGYKPAREDNEEDQEDNDMQDAYEWLIGTSDNLPETTLIDWLRGKPVNPRVVLHILDD